MSILKEHICQLEKDQLTFHQSELTSFFLVALDFRAKHSGVSLTVLEQSVAPNVTSQPQLCCFQEDLETTAEIEGYVIDCLVAMVMKLSEVTFRSLFFKVTAVIWPTAGCHGHQVWMRRLTQVPFLAPSSATGGNPTATSVC